ncbi:UDP-N-acetylmuramoylalanine--D-glutamate ligase MurD [Mucisphaera calidilacus]|uniref:UDP-N-acetylmuramoylalanine--D-glutamate ligase n=2 Tax=Mucisphaera calidilacus TaxID=2527982 RepID=A0A518BTI0_9BACT|nr:UDP-N-acetylmuramoylalanine--D-glutamate ligase MurD [Mucisphaera calidilacus]
MGLGRFGGGVGVTRFLAEHDARILLTDTLDQDRLGPSLDSLRDLIDDGRIELRLGEHREDDFTSADLVVVNPAVNPATNAYTRAASNAGVPLTSEIRLLIERLPTPHVLGITGSAGKSTTTVMLHHALVDALGDERVWLGGNLGGSLLMDLPRIQPDHRVVLELSSFMLDGLRHDRWSPRVAVVTNLHPNHLDWHGSFEHYADSKQQILEHQQPHDAAVLGSSCADRLRPRTPRVVWSDTSWVESQWLPPLRVLGEHNRANARLAIEAAGQTGFDRNAAAASLATFNGLPHRLRVIGEREGVRFVDDSKSTTPEAAILAIDACRSDFPDARLHVILGGYDKGADLAPLARHAAAHTHAIYAIGQTGPSILDAAQGQDAECVDAQTVADAVTHALGHTTPGDVVLLSPGCASWDQFTNYEQRGRAFAEAAGCAQ